MKVFDLRCALGHTFEGWVASEESYQEQLATALLSCPICADKNITKLPSVARLGLKSNQKEVSLQSKQNSGLEVGASHLMTQQMQALEAKVIEHVLQNTEDVGKEFAEEARKMHYGEALERGIRGQASIEEAQDLQEEGIEVVRLRFPVVAKKELQ